MLLCFSRSRADAGTVNKYHSDNTYTVSTYVCDGLFFWNIFVFVCEWWEQQSSSVHRPLKKPRPILLPSPTHGAAAHEKTPSSSSSLSSSVCVSIAMMFEFFYWVLHVAVVLRLSCTQRYYYDFQAFCSGVLLAHVAAVPSMLLRLFFCAPLAWWKRFRRPFLGWTDSGLTLSTDKSSPSTGERLQ